uniref:Uncharacterized protein n=1 Tax=Cacopsylla melanoneura TaxID=428564 RepID=A0A8D8PTG5_9HEMI
MGNCKLCVVKVRDYSVIRVLEFSINDYATERMARFINISQTGTLSLKMECKTHILVPKGISAMFLPRRNFLILKSSALAHCATEVVLIYKLRKVTKERAFNE